MPRLGPNGYPPAAPEPRGDGAPVPKDVRRYRNGDEPVLLCCSCAVRRRLRGHVVELVEGKSDGLVAGGICEDCGKSNV